MKIRQATLEDFEIINELNGVCYGFDPKSMSERFLKRYEFTFDEQYCVEIADQIVANARSIPLEQNVRGKWLKMGGIAMVVSDPEHRRRGYIRELMNFLIERMYEEGYSVSTLYPFKDTFYASFGYVNTPPTVRMEFNPNLLSKWKKLPQGYSVKRMDHEEAFPYYKEIHSKAMEKVHGGVKRTEKRWREYDQQSPAWYAVVFNSNGNAEGVMKYIYKGFGSGFEWAEEGRINISDFWTLTPKAKHSLFNFLFLHADQIVKVRLPTNPAESSYYNWLQGYFTTELSPINIWMARIINVQKTLNNMPTAAKINLKVNVIDSLLKDNNQTFAIAVKNNELIVTPLGDKKADLELTIEGLTALVYGVLSAEELEPFNWIKNASKEQKTTLSETFPRITPFMLEGF